MNTIKSLESKIGFLKNDIKELSSIIDAQAKTIEEKNRQLESYKYYTGELTNKNIILKTKINAEKDAIQLLLHAFLDDYSKISNDPDKLNIHQHYICWRVRSAINICKE